MTQPARSENSDTSSLGGQLSHPAFKQTGHRPWPLPDALWLWHQVWHDVAFLHWPVAAASLARLVPRGLTIDEFDGRAWIAVAPFWMSGIRLRGTPPLPRISTFPELNVRTYVRHGAKPGVWFFSLDAGNRLAVWAARRLYHLAYVYSQMAVQHRDERIHYSSRRPTGARFVGSYAPTQPVQRAQPGSLEHFLTERYRLYSADGEKLYFADIHHEPWPLQRAEAIVEHNDMLAANGLSAAGAPIVHFAKRLEVVIWPLQKLVT